MFIPADSLSTTVSATLIVVDSRTVDDPDIDSGGEIAMLSPSDSGRTSSTELVLVSGGAVNMV